MGEKLVIRPIDSGLRTNRLAFNIDNDSFPQLENAYQWRGRIKRKRGTSLLGRLRYYLGTTDVSGNITVTISPQPITSTISQFLIDTDLFSDPGGASPVTLLSTNGSATGTLNRTTGVLTITGSQPSKAVYYYPGLPVLGVRDFDDITLPYIATVAFDSKYSYTISSNDPYPISNNNYYLNPNTGVYSGYVRKSSWTKLNWNGQSYQQFWTTNYQNALWTTNGVAVPFSTTNVGMPYIPSASITSATQTSATTVDFVFSQPVSLVVGDFVFANEFTGASGSTINFQTGYVTNIAAGTYTVTFPNAAIGGAGLTPGILQYLTNNALDSGGNVVPKDCMRWYNGDPTGGTGVPSVYGSGWVNFCPPLFSGNPSFGISDLPPAQYYLVTAKMVLQFKDRLLFFGPVVQTSAPGSQIYLEDTIIYSQNGTPYYTASFTGSVTSATTVFNPLLVPTNQSAAPNAFFEDVTGFGGFFSAGLNQPITTVSSNEDVLILGFSSYQTRLVYTGNDVVPFNLYVINSEFGSSSTFSAINMDKGVITRGSRGYVISSQTGAQRVDLQIPDQVFQINLKSNGAERICAQRDYENEWIYFTYRANTSPETTYEFNTETLLYNYRDDSWGIFKESYTSYGLFRRASGYTWSSLTSFPWSSWNAPWDEGDTTILNPEVVAGNQQGFLLFREDETTDEATSLFVQNIVGATVTCPNHCLNLNDYIIFTGVQGTSGMTQLNNQVCKVNTISNANTFTIVVPSNPSYLPSGTYTGGAKITRAYVPFIQTKQFPISWELARKTRIGFQQYLLSRTDTSQITLLIFLSQDSSTAWNSSPIVPANNVTNSALIYSTVLYTCPESTNLGLTPANTNLQMIVYQNSGVSPQEQIWHRINTSLIGDTVQLGFTISESQMAQLDSTNYAYNAFDEVELHAIVIDIQPSSLLA